MAHAYAYNEVMLAAFVREKGINPVGRMGLCPISLYVDDDTAMAVGREIYGFPKKMAHMEVGAHEISVVRSGLAPEAGPGPVQPIRLLNAQWSADSGAAKAPFAVPLLRDFARLMVFYNIRHVTQSGARSCDGAELSQLTKVSLADLEMGNVSALHDLHLQVEASVNDPVHLLMRADRDVADIRASWGAKVEFSFSMASARIVGATAGALDTRVPSQILRESRGLGY